MGIVRQCREYTQCHQELDSVNLRLELLRISKIATDGELRMMLKEWERCREQPTESQVIATGQYDRT